METVRKLQEQVQIFGKQNRDLVCRLNRLLNQVPICRVALRTLKPKSSTLNPKTQKKAIAEGATL